MSKDVLVLFCAMFVGGVVSWAQTTSGAGSLSCPATISVIENAVTVEGWKGDSGQVERKFERASIFNGDQGGQEFELAPDNEKEAHGKVVQTWELKGYRTMKIFLRCRYENTPVVLSAEISTAIGTCTFRFDSDRKQRTPAKPSLSCH
jgi:hypothetical protein